MNTIVIVASIIAFSGLFFSGSPVGMLSNSYSTTTINGMIKENLHHLNQEQISSLNFDKDQVTQAAQYLLNGLNSGEINGDWLELHYGFDANLLDGVDKSQLIETTEHVLNSVNNGGEKLDKEWIQDTLVSDDYGGGSYAGAYILILVLFILLIIVGAGGGIGPG